MTGRQRNGSPSLQVLAAFSFSLQNFRASSTIAAFRDSQHKGRRHASFLAQAHLPAAFAVFKEISVVSVFDRF